MRPWLRFGRQPSCLANAPNQAESMRLPPRTYSISAQTLTAYVDRRARETLMKTVRAPGHSALTTQVAAAAEFSGTKPERRPSLTTRASAWFANCASIARMDATQTTPTMCLSARRLGTAQFWRASVRS